MLWLAAAAALGKTQAKAGAGPLPHACSCGNRFSNNARRGQGRCLMLAVVAIDSLTMLMLFVFV